MPKPRTMWDHPRSPYIVDQAIHRGCNGKVSYPSKKNAAARALVLAAEYADPSWNAYRCRGCRRWHVGHSNRRVDRDAPP